MQVRLQDLDENLEKAPAPLKQIGGSKFGKPETEARMGRFYRAEKKYRKQKDHAGKGKTLRDHRR